ncbi:hypothetical protein BGZ54_005810 [Gamsiella multidivaricata]|nr:hypothetical protein BGZ54_005810 [Gamsiella multidivaricata]
MSRVEQLASSEYSDTDQSGPQTTSTEEEGSIDEHWESEEEEVTGDKAVGENIVNLLSAAAVLMTSKKHRRYRKQVELLADTLMSKRMDDASKSYRTSFAEDYRSKMEAFNKKKAALRVEQARVNKRFPPASKTVKPAHTRVVMPR